MVTKSKKLNRIEEIIERDGVTIYSLAKASGMQYSQLHGYVKNKRQPSIENLFKLAKVLKVDVCEL